MRIQIPFENTYGTLPPRFYHRQGAASVSDPKLLAYNNSLAAELGISGADPQDLALVFSGNRMPDGADPMAQAYAGHQFGGFSPQLGDGRALLLGEVVDQHGRRRDIQLKGSGRTPFSRNGDGRAWLGPVLREYVLSEAMYALGIPTTRALAAVSTGDRVQREKGLPGAVLTRVAASHIRVGTFQYFYARQDLGGLQALFDYSCARHYPEAEGPLEFLQAVIEKQIALVVSWMSIGFIHGVMNTDNTAISGETIDYGPAAFIDTYHPATVYSSIDHRGRYAYDNQANIIAWNMAQLASSLLPLMPDEDQAVKTFTAAVNAMPGLIRQHWRQVFARKIGISSDRDGDEQLLSSLLNLMAEQQVDFTNLFSALPEGKAGNHFREVSGFLEWEKLWKNRISDEPEPEALMRRSNPLYLPRNHRIEQMIAAAVNGDLSPFERLNAVLAQPFTLQAEAEDLRLPPRPEEVVEATFCGT